MNSSMRVLTLQHYGETPEEDLEVTLSVMSIKMITAKNIIIQNRELKQTGVLFIDGDETMFNLSPLDLMQLQDVVGAYRFYDEE